MYNKMINREILLKYDKNLKIYLERFEEVEEIRQNCPFLNNNPNNYLGIVEEIYNNFAGKASEIMKIYQDGVKGLLEIYKMERNNVNLKKKEIKKAMDDMRGLDEKLDGMSKFAKEKFIPYYEKMTITQESLLRLSKYGYFRK